MSVASACELQFAGLRRQIMSTTIHCPHVHSPRLCLTSQHSHTHVTKAPSLKPSQPKICSLAMPAGLLRTRAPRLSLSLNVTLQAKAPQTAVLM